jgi:XTP/dITP diphosphohydrolase
MTTVVVATRSPDKLREITQMLGEIPELRVLDLDGAGVEKEPEEDSIEVFDSFAGNAEAKARYYAARSGLLTLADDSGLCVDALGGAPGVWSKRFSGRHDLAGVELDRANNALLLERLAGVPEVERTAHYLCAVALLDPASGWLEAVEGRCDGVILASPRGEGGFGYDPLFFLPEEGATFGELPPERKNRLSHRARAVAPAAERLRDPRKPNDFARSTRVDSPRTR